MGVATGRIEERTSGRVVGGAVGVCLRGGVSLDAHVAIPYQRGLDARVEEMLCSVWRVCTAAGARNDRSVPKT